MTSVLVLGGGFGGLEVATRVAEADPTAEVTVVDRSRTLTIGAGKLWGVVGLRPLADVSGDRSALENRGVRFVEAEITAIDAATRRVETTAGTLTGDVVVVALGAAFSRAHLDLLAPPAYNLYDPGSVPEINAALEGFTGGSLAIVVMGLPYKCPPAPYEAAFLVDRFLRDAGRREDVRIDVFTPPPIVMPVAGPEVSARVTEELRKRDVGVHTQHKLVSIADGRLGFENGSHDAGLVLCIPQHVVPPVIGESDLAGPNGWIKVDPATLRTSHEGVYAVGDCVSIPNAVGELPRAGIMAEGQGRVVADAIAGRAGSFDGTGYCFIEFGGGEAAFVEGDFLAEPRPDVRLAEPSREAFAAKERFVAERLARWLGSRD